MIFFYFVWGSENTKQKVYIKHFLWTTLFQNEENMVKDIPALIQNLNVMYLSNTIWAVKYISKKCLFRKKIICTLFAMHKIHGLVPSIFRYNRVEIPHRACIQFSWIYQQQTLIHCTRSLYIKKKRNSSCI